MQAIRVKYLPCTETKGSRLSASAVAGKVVVAYDDSLGSVENFEAAAYALCKKFGWPNKLVGGQLKDGSHVFTMLPVENGGAL